MIVAPSGDQAAVRDADGRLQIVGKRFNAFAAEQWLTADGDGRDPGSARDPDAPCDRLGCVAALPEGESLSIVLDRVAFDEDCARAEVVVSALTAPAGLQGEIRARREGAGAARRGRADLERRGGFTLTSDRSPLENRPWSPAPAPAPDEKIVRPGPGLSHGADPADAADEPGQGGRERNDPMFPLSGLSPTRLPLPAAFRPLPSPGVGARDYVA